MVEWLIPLVLVAACYLWTFLSLILHETSHLIAAKLVGFTPYAMKVGAGPLLFAGKVFGIDTQIRLWPLYGLAYANRMALEGLRWKGAIFALSGPMLDIVLLVILCTAVLPGLLKANSPSPWATAGIIISFGQAGILLASLFPRDVRIEGRLLPSDAKLFLSYISGATSKTISTAYDSYRTSVARYDDAFDLEESWLLQTDAISLTTLTEASEDYTRGHFETAAKKYLELLKSEHMTKGERAMFLDSLAGIPIFGNNRRFLDRAVEWAKEAHALCPNAPTIRGTLGSLYVEKEDYAAGIELLEPLTHPGNEVTDMSISACYLAKAYGKLGKLEESNRWLDFARKTGGAPAICEKIARELTSA